MLSIKGTNREQTTLKLGQKRKRRWESPLGPRCENNKRAYTHDLPRKKEKKSEKPSSVRRPTQTKVKKQVYLDLGQKHFDQTECRLCGMLFTPGVEQDEKAHKAFCKSQIIRFSLCKEMNQVDTFEDDKFGIVHITFRDDRATLKRVKLFKTAVVDKDMGFVDEGNRALKCDPGESVFLCIYRKEQRPIAFLSTERIQFAYALSDDALQTDKLVCSDLPKSDAVLGIRQVWVHRDFRYKGIARRMLDTARSRAVYNYHVPKNMLAFSQPTVQGRALASAYCGASGTLVYELSNADSK